jgi:phosphoglycolate phosphatase-like HAD superfamily hydrolase
MGRSGIVVWNDCDKPILASAPTLYAALERATAELRQMRDELWESITVEDEPGFRVVAAGEDESEIQRLDALIADCEAALEQARGGEHE